MRKFYFLPLALILFSCGGEEQVEEDPSGEEEIVVEFVDSLDYYSRKLNADPNNPAVKFERAKYFVRQGDVDNAKTDLEEILAKDSTDLDAQNLYADIHLSMLDLETAKYHYEYVLNVDTVNAGAFLGMAKIFAALDNFGKADYYISQSLRSNQYSAEPYFTRGLIYRSDWYKTGRQKSYDIAISSFQTAVEQEPDYYAAYIELGVMHAEIGDSIALEYYNSALDIYPESIEAWYNKGYFFQVRGEIDNAMSCYYTLRSIDSTWYKPYYNLGYIHMIYTEDQDSAIYYYKQCTKWDPTNYEAFNNLGLAWEKKGDRLNAKKYYQKAIEVNPDYQLAKDNLNALQ